MSRRTIRLLCAAAFVALVPLAASAESLDLGGGSTLHFNYVGDLGGVPGPGTYLSGNQLLYHPNLSGNLQFQLTGPGRLFIDGNPIPSNTYSTPVGVNVLGPFDVTVQDAAGNELYRGTVAGLSPSDPRYVSGNMAATSGGGGSGAAGPLVPCDICQLTELVTVAVNVFNWLIAVGGAVAVLAVIVAGIRYFIAVFQGASSGEIAAAKSSLGYAVLGVIFLLTAYVIVNSVYQALSGGQGSPPGLQ